MMGVTRRAFLSRVGSVAACGGVLGGLSGCIGTNGCARAAPRPPNIVLIVTDDQGWGDIHSHGNDKLDTPVLDRLAAEGARFERFYVSPVCAPTRASLLTGRYYQRAGVHGVTRGYETMRPGEVTIADVFGKAGYVTGCFGKWHNGAHYPYHPNGRGFDEFFGFCAGHWNNYFDTTLDHNGREVQTKGYITDVLTDAAIRFVRKNRSRPFFCYVPYNAPHSPWQVPDRYFDKYKVKGLDDKTACAYGMCENLDDNIGRLLRTLDNLGLTDQTVVVFLTDNGPNSDRYNGDMRGRKGSCDEGGIRVPLFVLWPGRIRPGTQVREIAAHIDLLPTLAELAGVRIPQDVSLDGVSLAALLQGAAESWPERMLFSQWGRRGSVRTERWRAVMRRPGRWELYDMVADPGQRTNVAAQHSGVLAQLRAAYDSWNVEVTKDGFDPIPVPIGYEQRPQVVLPGHEAFLERPDGKGISYNGPSGWANDWIANWTSVDAYAWWPVDVVKAGQYEVTLMYTCRAADAGAKMRVEIGGRSLTAVIDRAYDPEIIHSPDRVGRKEVLEQTWAPKRVGAVSLTEGQTKLVVSALEIPGAKAIDLKAVRVRRLP